MKKSNKTNKKIMINEKKQNLQVYTHKLMRNIVLDYFYTFIDNLNMSNSIWVLYLAYRGMSLFEIGLLEGIFHVTSVIFEIPSGSIADLLGRKKTMIAGRIFMALSCIMMILSGSFWQFAISFVFQALSYNFNSGAEEALVYDSLKYVGKEEKYTKIYGRINFLIEAAQGISTLIGGIIAEYSYLWCYIVCVMIAILSIVPVLFMKEPPVEKAKTVVMKVSDQIREHFKVSFMVVKENHRILSIIIHYSLVFAVYCVLLFYSQQFFSNLGFNKIQISIILFLAGIFSCLGALASDWLFKRSKDRMEFLAAFAIAASLIVFGINQLYPAIVALAVASFFNASLYPIQSNKLNQLIPTKQRATILSLNSLAFSVMMIVVFPAAGAVADVTGLVRVFLFIGIMGMVLSVILQKRHVKKLSGNVKNDVK